MQVQENTEAQQKEIGPVLMIRNLPKNFNEAALRQFLKQFDSIKNLKLLQSKNVGASLQVAYVQFLNSKITRVVAHTLDQYLIFTNRLQCTVLEKCRPSIFKHIKIVNQRRKRIDEINQATTEEQFKEQLEQMKQAQERRQQWLNSHGVKYQIPNIEIVDIMN